MGMRASSNKMVKAGVTQLKPICPCDVFSDYKLVSIDGRDWIERSGTIVRTYDLSNPLMQEALLKDFLKVKDLEAALRWIENYGMLQDSGLRTDSPALADSPPQSKVKYFFLAQASAKWIINFATELKRAEQDGDVSRFRSWIHPAEDIGTESNRTITFLPNEGEVRDFQGVFNTKFEHIPTDQLCVLSNEKLYDLAFHRRIC